MHKGLKAGAENTQPKKNLSSLFIFVCLSVVIVAESKACGEPFKMSEAQLVLPSLNSELGMWWAGDEGLRE